MPVPATINDLSTTAESNSPAGSEPALPQMDDFIRALSAFIAQLRDGKLNASSVSTFMQSVLDDADAATARATLGAVGLTGDQTIAGVKTFSLSPVVPTPVGGTDAASKAYVDSLIAAVGFPGEIRAMARLTAPTGWLLIDGKTIGNATSGATSRANADTAALFAELWNFPAASVPIYDSTGAASTRGASAAADFSAGKRLPLFTPDGGAFLRMWTPGQTRDAGRAAGSVQDHAMQDHVHAGGMIASGAPGIPGGNGGSPYNSGNTYGVVGANIATETRPYNLAIPHYIKL